MVFIQNLFSPPSIYIYLVIISIVIITDSLSLYKYELDIDHIEHSKETELVNFGTIRVTKFNRSTYVVDGYIDLLMDLTNDLWESFEIYSLAGNEYRKILERRSKQLCTFFQHDQVVVSKVIDSTSLAPGIKTCPLKAQRIYFYNTKMPTDRFAMEPTLFMKGMVKISVFHEDRLMTNCSVYFSFTRVGNIF